MISERVKIKLYKVLVKGKALVAVQTVQSSFEEVVDHCDDQKSPRAEPTEHGHTHSRGSPFSTLEGDIPTKWSTLLLVCMHIVCSGGVWNLR